MNLVKRTRSDRNGSTGLLARRNGQGLTPLRRSIEDLFQRAWSSFDDPWSMFESMPDFGFAEAWPAMDVSEDDKSVTLRFDVPGLDEENLEVEVLGDTLTVRGSREEEHEDRRLHRRERVMGSFTRSVSIPSYVDPESIEASYRKGVLTVSMRKVPGREPRRVQIAT